MKLRGFYDKDQSIVPNTAAHNKYQMDVSMVINTIGYAPTDEKGKILQFKVIRSNRIDPKYKAKYCALQCVEKGYPKVEWWAFHIKNCLRKEGDIIKSGDQFFKSGNTGVIPGTTKPVPPHTEHQFRMGLAKYNPVNYTVIKAGKPRNFVAGKLPAPKAEAPTVAPKPVATNLTIPPVATVINPTPVPQKSFIADQVSTVQYSTSVGAVGILLYLLLKKFYPELGEDIIVYTVVVAGIVGNHLLVGLQWLFKKLTKKYGWDD